MTGFFKKIFSREKKEKLDEGVKKTREGMWGKITRVLAGKKKIDEQTLDDLEEAFILADVGVDTTVKIMHRLEDRVARDKYINTEELSEILCDEVCDIIGANEEVEISSEPTDDDFKLPEGQSTPYVIMVVGVNGVGKTTTIGKLANLYQKAGNKVVLGAADTYRAAAIEQLDIWGERVGVPVVKQKMGSDPAAVAFDTLQSAKAKGADIVIIDTAGRLHNKVGLMNELTKIKNVMKRVVPDAPQEILLVLDGSTGQNAIEQARNFKEATDINCIAVTKLDGTAKGGAVIGICDQMNIPVKYIGLGEGIDDVQIFRPREFVKSLFQDALMS